jgi:hypothetical protein
MPEGIAGKQTYQANFIANIVATTIVSFYNPRVEKASKYGAQSGQSRLEIYDQTYQNYNFYFKDVPGFPTGHGRIEYKKGCSNPFHRREHVSSGTKFNDRLPKEQCGSIVPLDT